MGLIKVCKICDAIIEDEFCENCHCTCGNIVTETSYGICVECGLLVCEDCQLPTAGPPNPMIDYPVHKDCFDNRWDLYETQILSREGNRILA